MHNVTHVTDACNARDFCARERICATSSDRSAVRCAVSGWLQADDRANDDDPSRVLIKSRIRSVVAEELALARGRRDMSLGPSMVATRCAVRATRSAPLLERPKTVPDSFRRIPDHLVRRCNQPDDRGETRVSPICRSRSFNNLIAGRLLQDRPKPELKRSMSRKSHATTWLWL
jgi:hypothetical protein